MSDFSLHIDAYTPATIPMKRLAEYMLPLAALLGSESGVHFRGLRRGSTAIRVCIDPENATKVEERLAQAGHDDASSDLVCACEDLNKLLREDNAIAALKRGNAKIIKFPGRNAPKPKDERIGPVWERGQLEGTVISVGGKGDTKNIRLSGRDGEEYSLSTRDLELARRFGYHLFSTVRVTGEGKWFRNEQGGWELEHFHAQSCEPVENDISLIEAVATLRAIEGDGWRALPDPFAVWQALRKN
jgi:hypothetical protein